MDRDLPINQVICGDNREVMAQWPDECIDMMITSPPYWGLRNYGTEAITIYGGDKNCNHDWGTEAHGGDIRYRGHNSIIGAQKNPEIWRQEGKKGFFCIKCNAWRGQLGLEPDFNLYIDHLLEITAELKRVLKKTGSFYLNMGDTYGGNGGAGGDYYKGGLRERQPIYKQGRLKRKYDKCLLDMPNRLRDRMVDEQGWTCINAIIWHKKNPMPCSVKRRRTNTYEYLFHFVKNTKPIFYINLITMKAVSRKPKDGVEGIDWEWRERRLKGKKTLIKFTLWQMQDYFFDLDAIREPHSLSSINRNQYKWFSKQRTHSPEEKRGADERQAGKLFNPAGKNPGDVIFDDRKGLRVPGQAPHGIHRKRHSGYYGADGEYLVHPSGKNPGDVMEIQQKLYIVTLADENREIFKASIPANEVRNCFGHWFGEGIQEIKTDLWIINTQPFPEAHFATFPLKLCEDPIKSSCPLEICKKCGLPRVRVIKINRPPEYNPSCEAEYADQVHSDWHNRPLSKIYNDTLKTTRETIGWTDCGCNAGWRPGIMLDPFCGSGRALIMAKKLRRDRIGIDIVQKYCEMSKRGLENVKVSISA